MRTAVEALWQATVGSSQLLRFVIVGGIGFLVDAGVVSLLVAVTDLGLYWSRLLSFLCAATATWALNRNFTFRGQGSVNRVREWGAFLAVSIGGAAINYGVYVLTIEAWPLARHFPALAVAFGSLAGMVFNFPASKYLVFRRPKA